jgi:hypothetical protein
MPTKTLNALETELRTIPLPNHGGRYAVVSHGFVIDQTRAELDAAGFTITRELYKSSIDGQMAQGIYHLNYGDDADMGLMFAWSNSYNKMMRFKCAIGAHVFVCSNGVVTGDLASYKRKHIGPQALTDVTSHIQTQISKAGLFYNQLVADKEMLKEIILTPRNQGRILGELFAKDEILTLTQVGIVKREMDKPTFNYNCDRNSAWAMYNHVTLALKQSHPMHYLDDHQLVHRYFVNEYGQLITPQPIGGVVEEIPEGLSISAAMGSDFDIDAMKQQLVEDRFGVTFL